MKRVTIGISLVLAIALTASSIPGRAQESSPARQQPPPSGGAPRFLGIHSAAPPVTAVGRTTAEAPGLAAKRDIRDNRWSGQLLQPLDDPGMTGYLGPESTTVTHIDYVGKGRDALPLESSNCVVVGHVQSANAFVTPDRTGVYSEFSLVVDSVVGQDAAQHVAAGARLIGIRGGGTVVFRSGHRQKILFEGIGYPKVGPQYLFFLRMRPNSDDYGILTAYELASGKAYALDDGEPFLRYEGADQRSLLRSVIAKMQGRAGWPILPERSLLP